MDNPRWFPIETFNLAQIPGPHAIMGGGIPRIQGRRDMLLYQRLCLVLAQEGISGLYRRARRKLTTGRSKGDSGLDEQIAAAKQEYARLMDDFATRAHELGHGEEV